jgi:hypothetical protein
MSATQRLRTKKKACRGLALIWAVAGLAAVAAALTVFNQYAASHTTFLRSSAVIVTRQNLSLLKAAIQDTALDADGAGYYNVILAGAGNTVPASLGLSAVSKDGWGNAVRYCTGPADGNNAAYAANSGWAAAAGVKAQLVSAGQDGVFQTACGAAVASGDDLMVVISEADLRYAQGGLGGMQLNHATSTVSTVTPGDDVNLQGDLFTIGDVTSLPTLDPFGAALQPGTLAYLTVAWGGKSPGFYIWTGTKWGQIQNDNWALEIDLATFGFIPTAAQFQCENYGLVTFLAYRGTAGAQDFDYGMGTGYYNSLVCTKVSGSPQQYQTSIMYSWSMRDGSPSPWCQSCVAGYHVYSQISESAPSFQVCFGGGWFPGCNTAQVRCMTTCVAN